MGNGQASYNYRAGGAHIARSWRCMRPDHPHGSLDSPKDRSPPGQKACFSDPDLAQDSGEYVRVRNQDIAASRFPNCADDLESADEARHRLGRVAG
jgi:hypothetical protein